MPFRKFEGWIVPADEREKMLRRVWSDAEYLPAIIERCPQRRVVVQAGAYIGVWPKVLAKHFQTVYAFEPDPVCFSCFAQNTAELDNVVRLQAAVGDAPALVDLVRYPTKAARQHVGGSGVLPTLRIDDLGLDTCDLIYLDTEGKEYRGLRGALDTIRCCRPIIAIEEQDLGERWFGEDPGAAVRMLEDLGYRIVDRQGRRGIDLVFAPC